MNDAALSAALVEALQRRAAQEAPGALLASVTVDVLLRADAVDIEAQVVRRTRTLMFMQADASDANGARIATASSVYKISP
jgi:acyl-coenzyme A thioesterase PaaI-like protein